MKESRHLSLTKRFLSFYANLPLEILSWVFYVFVFVTLCKVFNNGCDILSVLTINSRMV